MNKQNAIEIENLSKEYRLGVVSTGTLSHDLNRWWHRIRGKEDPYLKVGEANVRDASGESEYVWALKDINLEVKDGEVLGIIGKNGAGKSTLLKILSRVTGPTTGEIQYRGRIGSLLEVGTGFHQELTGRENIFLNGAILGMTKNDIKNKFDDIIDFSGCARYVDTPVKRYSSGMMVRMGFAVAAFLEPEILVVDEVLAVGDAEFQKKAIGKMQDVSRKEGRTVLFVSHNMAAIKTLCNSTLLLNKGMISKKGTPDEVVANYLQTSNDSSTIPIAQRTNRKGAGQIKFEQITITDSQGSNLDYVTTGDEIKFCIKFSQKNPKLIISTPLEIGIVIRDEFDSVVTTLASFFTDESPVGLDRDSEVICSVPRIPLLAGQYYIDLWCAISSEQQDFIANSMTLRVEEGNFFKSSHTWRPRGDRHGFIVVPQQWAHSNRNK
jgi:lipopolysaccharide transport system ATP-binding protein